MPEYNVGIVLDGWARIRVTARNREEVRAKLASTRLVLTLIDANHESIGQIVDPPPLIDLKEEEIEVYRPSEDTEYHAPIHQTADDVDIL